MMPALCANERAASEGSPFVCVKLLTAAGFCKDSGEKTLKISSMRKDSVV